MNSWNDFFTRLMTWKGPLPRSLRLHNVFVHSSALLAIPLLAFALMMLRESSTIDDRWQPVALTLPLVLVCSLAVRTLAQRLAIGSQAEEFQMIIGPFGNQSHDYEELSGPTMMSYAVAGQSATLITALMGVLILGTINSGPVQNLNPSVTFASLLDFRTGWSSQAWASQVVWVNGLLFLFHLLPAAPFDARALFVGWCNVSHPGLSPAGVHRALSSTDSHLGFGLAGISLAMAINCIIDKEAVVIWYGLLVISIYLLVVSHFEAYQAQQIEELSEPPLPRRLRTRSARVASDFPDFEVFGEGLDDPSPHEILDVDEILRKLHREGRESLSPSEKEALLSASRELQARRHPRD